MECHYTRFIFKNQHVTATLNFPPLCCPWSQNPLPRFSFGSFSFVFFGQKNAPVTFPGGG